MDTYSHTSVWAGGLGGCSPPGLGKMIFFGQSGNFSAIFLQRCPGFFGQNWFSPPKKIGPYAYVFTYAWYLKNLVWILQAFTPTGWRQKPLWGPTLNFDRTYLANGTWYQQSKTNLSIYGDSLHPPNLVNFGPERTENGWRVFAHPLNFRIGRHCQPYCMDVI